MVDKSSAVNMYAHKAKKDRESNHHHQNIRLEGVFHKLVGFIFYFTLPPFLTKVWVDKYVTNKNSRIEEQFVLQLFAKCITITFSFIVRLVGYVFWAVYPSERV